MQFYVHVGGVVVLVVMRTYPDMRWWRWIVIDWEVGSWSRSAWYMQVRGVVRDWIVSHSILWTCLVCCYMGSRFAPGLSELCMSSNHPSLLPQRTVSTHRDVFCDLTFVLFVTVHVGGSSDGLISKQQSKRTSHQMM